MVRGPAMRQIILKSSVSTSSGKRKAGRAIQFGSKEVCGLKNILIARTGYTGEDGFPGISHSLLPDPGGLTSGWVYLRAFETSPELLDAMSKCSKPD